MRIYLFLIFLMLASGCEPLPGISSSPAEASIRTAREYLKFDENTDRTELEDFLGVDPVRYEWCAAFVNAVLAVNGIPGSESVSDHPLMARSFLGWGEKVTEPDKPKRGDVVIFPRGKAGWQGHVGFYTSTYWSAGIKYYIILGGNQDDKVSYDAYPAHRALSIRRHPLANSSP